jgi:hypothetical protein
MYVPKWKPEMTLESNKTQTGLLLSGNVRVVPIQLDIQAVDAT